MADIPGIIEGASEGAGLGHDFLRHVERCRLLVHVVDVSGSEGRDPVEDFDVINRELREYEPALADRPQIVVANKCDIMTDDGEVLEKLRAHVSEMGYPLLQLSAVTHQGTVELIKLCAEKLSTLPPIAPFEVDYVEPEPVLENAEDVRIERTDDGLWQLEGEWLKRVAASVNFSDYESRMFFDRCLRKAGIFDRLEDMGIKDGETVCIYDLMFDFRY